MRSETQTNSPSPLEVLANPEAFLDQPALFQAAWAAHAESRGKHIRFDHLPEPHHHFKTENDQPATAGEILERLEGRAAEIVESRKAGRALPRGCPA